MVQPNTVYDPDADERPAHQTTPSGDSSDPRGNYDPQTMPAGNASDPRSEYDSQTAPKGDASDPRGDLSNAEREGGLSNAGGSAAGGLGAAEAAAGAMRSGLYNANPALGVAAKIKGALRVNNKRRTLIGGGVASLIGGGVIFVLMIASGPGQLIHLSKILQKPGFGTEKSVAKRTNGLFRYASSGGDIGETRVGHYGSRVFAKTITQLADIGVEFQRNPRTGNPKSMTIDDDKLSRKYPELRSMSLDEKRAFLSSKFGVPPDKLVRVNGKFAVNTRDIGIKATRALTANSLTLLEDGKTITAINFRAMEKFFNIPSLFHPFKRAVAKQENKAATKAERKVRERERMQAREPQPSSRFAAARSNLRGKIDGNRGKLSGALLITAGVCIIRDIADDVPVVNRGAVAVPAAIGSVDKIAGGSQIQSNEDVSLQQAGDTVASFTDANGKTIWDGKALQLLANPNKPATGEDIDAGYQQAFAVATTAQNIKKTVGGGTVGGLVCSPVGQVIQVAGSLALLASGPFTGTASWGVFAAKTSASMAATAGIIHLLQTQFTNLLSSDKVIPELLSGPQGGNLMAFGAREASSIAARSSGGVALSNTESARLEQEQLAIEEKEFRSKNLFARVFDKNDYRSLSSSVARSVSPDASENITKVASSITNLGSIFSSTFSTLLPKAKAAEQYNWGFPSYGIPQEILDDPAYEDPYDNAGRIAELLNGSSGQGYIDRAKKCFGVNISKGTDGWQVIAESDVNPNEQEYLDANCNDLSDDNWKRMILFVFDSRTMDAIACYEGGVGSNQSCSDLGLNGASSDSSAATESASPTVKVEDLGKSSAKLDCAEDTKDLGVVTSKYTGAYKKESGSMNIRLCQVTDIPGSGNDKNGNLISGGAVVEARVSGAWAALAKKAKEDGIKLTSSSSFRLADSCGGTGDGTSCARPGQSAHQTGWAIDFSSMGGFTATGNPTSCAGRMTYDSPQWKWMKDNAENFGIKQYSAESWHWDFIPAANRCGK